MALGAALLPVLLPGFVAAAVGYVDLHRVRRTGAGSSARASSCRTSRRTTATHVCDLLVGDRRRRRAAPCSSPPCAAAARRRRPRARGSGCRCSCSAAALAVGLLARDRRRGSAPNRQDVLFSGQASCPASSARTRRRSSLVLLVAKSLAYAVSLGCGFRGGPDLPGDLPRHRARVVAGRLVRRLADARRRRGRRRRHGRADRG